MFRKLTLTFMGVLIFLLLSAVTVAQDKPKDMLYRIHKDFVVPKMVPQYEETLALLMEQLGYTITPPTAGANKYRK